MSRPNVLLIQVDQMHAACLSALENPNVMTPNLDRLVEEGTLFRSAICQHPACMPSRTSMLTGQYLSTSGAYCFSGLSKRESTWIQQTFKDAGYQTGAFGKFHVRNAGREQWAYFDESAPTLPEDESMSCPPGNTYRDHCLEKGAPWPNDQIHGHVPPLYPKVNGGLSEEKRQDMFGFDTPKETRYTSVTSLENSLETWTTNKTIDFMSSASEKPSPFFAYISYDRPHFPNNMPEPWLSKSKEKAKKLKLTSLPTQEDIESWPGWQQELMLNPRFGAGSMKRDHYILWLASYYTLVEFVDSEIGRLLAKLESLDLLHSTHIVFTSDHGDLTGDRGMINKPLKNSSPSLTHVPYIWRPAGHGSETSRGNRVQEAVELVDLYPTLCDLCGIEKPENLEGRSLVPQILHGASGDSERVGLCETYWTRTIEQNDLMLVFAGIGEANNELYDLKNDPLGYRNVYEDPKYSERRFKLKVQLLKFLFKRHYGGWSEVDVNEIDRGFDPQHDELPPLTNSHLQFAPEDPLENKGLFNFFRCGVSLINNHHSAYLAFNNEEILLFNGGVLYPTRNDTISVDISIIEPMVNATLRLLMTQSYPTSMFDVQMPITEPVTAERLTAWLGKAEQITI